MSVSCAFQPVSACPNLDGDGARPKRRLSAEKENATHKNQPRKRPCLKALLQSEHKVDKALADCTAIVVNVPSDGGSGSLSTQSPPISNDYESISNVLELSMLEIFDDRSDVESNRATEDSHPASMTPQELDDDLLMQFLDDAAVSPADDHGLGPVVYALNTVYGDYGSLTILDSVSDVLATDDHRVVQAVIEAMGVSDDYDLFAQFADNNVGLLPIDPLVRASEEYDETSNAVSTICDDSFDDISPADALPSFGDLLGSLNISRPTTGNLEEVGEIGSDLSELLATVERRAKHETCNLEDVRQNDFQQAGPSTYCPGLPNDEPTVTSEADRPVVSYNSNQDSSSDDDEDENLQRNDYFQDELSPILIPRQHRFFALTGLSNDEPMVNSEIDRPVVSYNSNQDSSSDEDENLQRNDYFQDELSPILIPCHQRFFALTPEEIILEEISYPITDALVVWQSGLVSFRPDVVRTVLEQCPTPLFEVLDRWMDRGCATDNNFSRWIGCVATFNEAVDAETVEIALQQTNRCLRARPVETVLRVCATKEARRKTPLPAAARKVIISSKYFLSFRNQQVLEQTLRSLGTVEDVFFPGMKLGKTKIESPASLFMPFNTVCVVTFHRMTHAVAAQLLLDNEFFADARLRARIRFDEAGAMLTNDVQDVLVGHRLWDDFKFLHDSVIFGR